MLETKVNDLARGRTELRGEVGDLRADGGRLRIEIDDLRVEMRKGSPKSAPS